MVKIDLRDAYLTMLIAQNFQNSFSGNTTRGDAISVSPF